jgi:hypothetical protein
MTKVFLGISDLAHVTPNVQNWLWLRTDGVGKYYKNTMKLTVGGLTTLKVLDHG